MLAQLVPAAWAGVSVLDTATTTKKGNPAGTIVLVVLLLAVGAVVVSRSRRRARSAQEQQAEIAVGSTVVTRAGLIATLIDRNDSYVVLQLDDGTRARFVPQAVARVWQEPELEELTAEEAAGEPPADDGPSSD